MLRLHARSVSGCAIVAYPLTSDLRYPVRPVNAPRFWRSVGCFQSTMAVSSVRSGQMPIGPTCAPANTASVMKKLDLAGERERPFSQTQVSIILILFKVILKSSPARPPSLTESLNNVPTRSPRACAVILAKVNGAPVKPNSMCL
jgi:hypothetical protein